MSEISDKHAAAEVRRLAKQEAYDRRERTQEEREEWVQRKKLRRDDATADYFIGRDSKKR